MNSDIPQSIRKRTKVLRKEITRLRDLYHKDDTSEISDEALDSLKHELASLEQKYPDLVTPDSPTQVVSGGVKEGFAKVPHKVRQWSFNDIFSEDELQEFDARMHRGLDIETPIEYFAEEKIDGVKIILEYQKGKLVVAATRGDGRVGENITENVRTIQSVPRELNQPVDIIVEGEAFITTKEFEKINAARKKEGYELYANPRNLVAGSLRQLDASITASRNLSVFIYDIGQYTMTPQTQAEEVAHLSELGFPINENTKLCRTLDAIVAFWSERHEQKDELPYWIDGVVVKVNNRSYQEQLGYTGKAPRFAVAFKFPAEQATTVLESITFQVGRTGVVTPVANLQPLQIAGTTVARATLHNEDQITRLDVRVGDTVVVQKAGDIIPEIVSVVKNLRPKNAKKFVWPAKVEGCGGDGSIERIDGDVAWRCVDRNSEELIIKQLSYFASKNAFDIDRLGERTVRQFVEEGLLREYADIYTLQKREIEKLEGFKEKSAQNLLDSVAERTTVTLERLLIALSIDGIGEETAHLLAKNFKTLEDLQCAPAETIQNIYGVGKTIADDLAKWFADETKQKMLGRLLEHITVTNVMSEQDTSHKLYGKRVVVTGKIEPYGREEIKQRLREIGAIVSESVSGKTDFLLAGTDAGSKLQKAQDLQVVVVQGDEIPALIGE